MELNKIDEQIQKIQLEKNQAIKKLKEKKKEAEKRYIENASKELLDKFFGEKWLNLFETIKADPECNVEVLINGVKFDKNDLK